MTTIEQTEQVPLYELRNVQRSFRVGGSDIHAVDGIDLTIGRGEFVSIQGPSGSGKTTLLQLLGLLDTATSGTLLFDGLEVSHFKDPKLTGLRSSEVGFVFQQFNLIPTLTAIENVEAALVPRMHGSSALHVRAEELLQSVGLADRANHLPTLLSGGEQQRVAIARALANKPRVVLADEPTGNLDSTTASSIVSLLADLSQREGVTILLITHDLDIAQQAQRQLRMRDGKLEEVTGH